MINRILPSIERLQDNLSTKGRRHDERFTQLESAAAELAGEISALKAGKNIQANGDVRAD